MPQTNKLKSNTCSNNVCRQGTESSVNSPTCWIIYIAYFQYFQIIHTSNQSRSQRDCYSHQQPTGSTCPNNSSFSQKTINRGQSCLRSHKHPPSKCCCCGTLILPFQIPNILGPCYFRRRSVRTSHWNKKKSPNPEIDHNVNKHMSPHRSNTGHPRTAQGHQQQTHVSDTTICQQSLKVCLSLGRLCPNNHREVPKKSLRTPKGCTPLRMPVTCPKAKNSNFWLHCNPQGHTSPCSSVHIWNPKMQRSRCLFPL